MGLWPLRASVRRRLDGVAPGYSKRFSDRHPRTPIGSLFLVACQPRDYVPIAAVATAAGDHDN
jgi:hypothetical protein